MDLFSNLFLGFSIVFTWTNLLFCLVGVLIGTLIGVLPGIGPIATISILLPATFRLDPVCSIILLAGVYYGAMYGGSTTSILVNIPGEAASIVTCLDGYQMARQGRAGPALGMSAIGSFIGGTASVIGLMLLAPVLARFALRFGPPEYFALMLFSLTMVTYLCKGSIMKGLAMAVAGLICATVGQDPVTGHTRFTFDSMTLTDGVGIVPASMGMFGIAEIFTNIEERLRREVFTPKISGLWPTRKDFRDSGWPIARGTAIGFFTGILPGVGSIIPTFMAYAAEKRLSRYPERFGTGVIEGVASPETANNAHTGGSLVTLLSLGIPGNAVMAVLLGAFIIHGVQPSPLLINEHPDLFWGTIASMYVGNGMLLVLNLPLIGIWIKILKIPYDILFPLIVVFCFIGAYSLSNNYYEILIMVVFGVIGYLARKLGFECAPFILGIVLGPMIETALRQSLRYGDPLIFVSRPICAFTLGVTFLLAIIPIFPKIRSRRKKLEEVLDE